MQGCEHNILREIIFPEQKPVPGRYKKTNKVGKSFHPGDLITLRCPKGCADIYIMVNTGT